MLEYAAPKRVGPLFAKRLGEVGRGEGVAHAWAVHRGWVLCMAYMGHGEGAKGSVRGRGQRLAHSRWHVVDKR